MSRRRERRCRQAERGPAPWWLLSIAPAGDSIQRQRLNHSSALKDLFFLAEGTWVAGRGADAEKRHETFASHLPLSTPVLWLSEHRLLPGLSPVGLCFSPHKSSAGAATARGGCAQGPCFARLCERATSVGAVVPKLSLAVTDRVMKGWAAGPGGLGGEKRARVLLRWEQRAPGSGSLVPRGRNLVI